MRVTKLFVLAAVVYFFGVSSVLAEPTFTPPAGYTSSVYYTHSDKIQSFDIDASGNLYLFKDNQYITKYSGGGETTLYNYGSSIYGSFLTVKGGTVYFGESSGGVVKSMPTSGGSATDLFTLSGNYDMAFNNSGQAFLSANPGGMSSENKIYHWNGTTTDLIGDMGGYSGPLAFDSNGDLFYGFPNYGAGEVVYFTSTQIAGALANNDPDTAELGSSDWTSYESGLDACSGFVFDDDATTQDLFSSSWQNSVTRVYGLNSSDAFGTGDSPSFIRFVPGPGDFEPYAGAGGGSLYILTTDWTAGNSIIYELQPIPEPATSFLLASGLMGVFAISRKKKK